jgi:hypothetical protein
MRRSSIAIAIAIDAISCTVDWASASTTSYITRLAHCSRKLITIYRIHYNPVPQDNGTHIVHGKLVQGTDFFLRAVGSEQTQNDPDSTNDRLVSQVVQDAE